MCIGGKVRQPDTSRQEAEAARQRSLEDERARKRLDDETDRLFTEVGDQERRYDEERVDSDFEADRQGGLLEDFTNRYLANQERAYEFERRNRLRDDARADIERRRAGALAEDRATQARALADARQARLREAAEGVDSAFGGYDDAYFNKFRDSFLNARRPGIAREFDRKNETTAFKLARNGILQSSGAGSAFGRVANERAGAERQLAADATAAMRDMRSQFDARKQDALRTALLGAQLSSDVLPEGTSADINAQFDQELAFLDQPDSDLAQVAFPGAPGLPPAPGTSSADGLYRERERPQQVQAPTAGASGGMPAGLDLSEFGITLPAGLNFQQPQQPQQQMVLNQPTAPHMAPQTGFHKLGSAPGTSLDALRARAKPMPMPTIQPGSIPTMQTRSPGGRQAPPASIWKDSSPGARVSGPSGGLRDSLTDAARRVRERPQVKVS